MPTHTLGELGQVRPGAATATPIYSPAANTEAVFRIVICNTTAAAALFRIYVDHDGTTYDQTTALAYDIPIAANTTITFPPGNDKIMMNDSNGTCAVESNTASALTFSAYGEEFTE